MTELERRIKAKIPGPDTGIEVRHTMCDICSPGMHCGINAYIKDGKVIKIEGIDGHPSNDGRLCTKGMANREYIYREDRIRTPLRRTGRRGEGRFDPFPGTRLTQRLQRALTDVRKPAARRVWPFTLGIPNGTASCSDAWPMPLEVPTMDASPAPVIQRPLWPGR